MSKKLSQSTVLIISIIFTLVVLYIGVGIFVLKEDKNSQTASTEPTLGQPEFDMGEDDGPKEFGLTPQQIADLTPHPDTVPVVLTQELIDGLRPVQR